MNRYLDGLEPGFFFGRDGEMERFGHLVRDLTRGWGRSVLLAGRPGLGKTELLVQFHLRLFRECGSVVPFYHRFDSSGRSEEERAADFVEGFAAQYLAFRRQDIAVGGAGMRGETLAEELRREEDEAAAFLREVCRQARNPAGAGTTMSGAALLPLRFARATGWKVLLLLDDMHNLAAEIGPGAEIWPQEALRHRDAPLVFTGDGAFRRRMEEEGGPGSFENWEVAPLPSRGAQEMSQSLLRVAGIELHRSRAMEIAELAGRVPGIMESLVRGLARRPGQDEVALYRNYAASLCHGDIYRYWKSLFDETFPALALRRDALEVLVYCLKEELPPEAGRLAEMMIKSRGEVEEALQRLCRAGVVSLDCSRVRVEEDPTLRDFVLSSYEREVRGMAGDFVEASLAARKLDNVEETRRQALRERNRAAIADLLQSWDGQQVPKVLFNASDFIRAFDERTEEETLQRLGDDESLLTLPGVVSLAAGQAGGEAISKPVEVDALAWAFHRSGRKRVGKVCWIVRIHDGASAARRDVEEFEAAVASLETGGDLEHVKVVRWFLAPEFDGEAAARAGRLRIMTSTFRQAGLFGRLMGRETLLESALDERRDGAVERLDFDMEIPMVTETELVAARAVEQVAENMNFAADEVGRIRMAIVEACINAFEHSGRRGGKVHLRFTSSGSSLLVRVENKGIKITPGEIAPVSAKKGMTKRGWGLSLIRELMDEVEFEPRDDGVSLVMVKHMRGKDGPGEQVRDDNKSSS